MPVVSVIMVFHRDTPFLRPAIASICAQTLADWELVLVDNGTGLSPDALAAPGRDPRVRWVRLPENRGIPAGHNAGVAAARGEFIALLDYDDIALPHRLERQVARLRAEPALGLVSSLAETIDERGAVTGREFALVEPAAQRAYTQFAAPVVTPAYAGRRDIFARLPYREIFPVAADFDFLARAAEITTMAAVPEVLLQYRRHAAQTTTQRHAAIEAQQGAIRLLTAQRRGARVERLAENLARSVMSAERLPAASALDWARHALGEGCYALAAYQARRAVVLERSVRQVVAASGIAARAIGRARGEARMRAVRLFFNGPVRALNLLPA